MKTDKEFKCVDFKHAAQIQIYKDIKNLAPEGELEYFHRRVEAGVFGKWWEKLQGEPVAVGGQSKKNELQRHR
jgi:hypothetical protein